MNGKHNYTKKKSRTIKMDNLMGIELIISDWTIPGKIGDIIPYCKMKGEKCPDKVYGPKCPNHYSARIVK